MYISATINERRTEKLSLVHLEQAVEAISENGYVIIEDVIPHDPLDMLKEKMDQDAKKPYQGKYFGQAKSVGSRVFLDKEIKVTPKL